MAFRDYVFSCSVPNRVVVAPLQVQPLQEFFPTKDVPDDDERDGYQHPRSDPVVFILEVQTGRDHDDPEARRAARDHPGNHDRWGRDVHYDLWIDVWWGHRFKPPQFGASVLTCLLSAPQTAGVTVHITVGVNGAWSPGPISSLQIGGSNGCQGIFQGAVVGSFSQGFGGTVGGFFQGSGMIGGTQGTVGGLLPDRHGHVRLCGALA